MTAQRRQQKGDRVLAMPGARGWLALVATAAIGGAMADHANAANVRMRLVRADSPDEKVSTAVTRIDVEGERQRVEAEQKLAETLGRTKGGAAAAEAQKVELKPVAEFDRYCNYMRGIVVDGKFPFQRMYEGSYLGRSDEITLNLPDGEHRIDPGNHVFRVAGEQVSTQDPTMRVKDGVLEVVLYPVTVIAMDGSAVRQMPAEVLRLPVTPRVAWNEESIIPKENLVADNATFKRMTLYVAANALGLGYRVSPSERNFLVGPDGVVILDEAGKPATDRGVYTEGKFTIVLPKMSVPVVMRGRGMTVRIMGPAGTFSAETDQQDELKQRFTAFSARTGANIRFGRRAENGPVLFRGDFGAFPRRQLLFDATTGGSQEPRLFSVALAAGSVKAGAALTARIEAVDAMDAGTITPFQAGAFLLTTPILRDDGTLLSDPDATTPEAQWRRLNLKATAEPDMYAIEIPADVASSVYYVRIVGDRRGRAGCGSPLHLDFVQGIVNPAASSTLSVFCPDGRKAFLLGADIDFSAVVKTTVPVAAGRIRIALRSASGEILLHEAALPAMQAGQYPLHFAMNGAATALLRAGAYQLVASAGPLQSNAWPLQLVEPRNRNGAPQFDEGWLVPNFDDGIEYVNTPGDMRAAGAKVQGDITMANAKRERLERQAAIRAERSHLQIVDWSGFSGGHANYQGRDNSSEVAQIEALLRGELALPSPEVYYYQNNFEAVNDALLRNGMDHYNSTTCFITPLSLIHSLPDQVNAKQRQHQLIGQIARKFENFRGISPMFMSTSPLGNSEIPDPTRNERLLAMEANFEKTSGFKAPGLNEVTEYIRALLAGKQPTVADVGTRWEAHQTMVNTLMDDYFVKVRTAVDPVAPGIAFINRGPSWGGDTASGTYPELCNATQEPLIVFTGHGDSGHDCIWEPYLKTMVFRMSGRECWGVDGALFNAPMVKHNMGMYLMAGALGFGYLGGAKPEWGTASRKELAGVAEDILDIRPFLEAYGPVFRQARHRGDVAIFYPLNQSMYDEASLEKLDSLNTLDGALLQMAMLGYSCETLTEKMLEAGEAKRFKAVVVPLLYYIRPQHRQALETYAAGGGTLLAGSASRIVLKGARTIEDDFQEQAMARSMWSFQGPVDFALAWIQAEMRRKAPALRAALEPAVKPFAAPRTDTMLLQTAEAGDARYTFVCGFLYPSWMGTGRLTGNLQVSGPLGEANENTLMPQKTILDMPEGVTTYDLLSQKLLAATPAGNGRAGVECDLSLSPFRILVSLPAPLAKLRVELPKEATLGQSVPLRVLPLDKAGKALNVRLPIEIGLFDSAGAALRKVYGTTAAADEEPFRVPATAGYAPGAWKLRVKDLVTGRVVESALQVRPADALPFGDAIHALAAVDVQDAGLIREFIEARKKDGEPVLILLDESQPASRAGTARELAGVLQGLGVKAEVKSVNAPGVFGTGERMRSYGGRFHEMAPEQFIDHHVVLLGSEGENVLLEELQESRLFRRPMTASYPGPGRATLALARSPFAFMKDVLCVMAPDEAGLQAGVQQLKSLPAETPAAPAAKPGAAAAALAGQDLEGTVDTGSAFSAMEGSPVLAIACASGADRVAFGVSGYGKNVFVFDGAGNPVSEDMVGHIFVSGLGFVKGGEFMTVTTEGMSYLRETAGKLRWQLGSRSCWTGSGVCVDPDGRYVVYNGNGYFTVYDLNLNALWGFDEWDKCETTREILFGRKAAFIATAGNGKEILYRLTGKEPGAAGATMDVLVAADALTGKENRRVAIGVDALLDEAGRKAGAKIRSIQVVEDGAAFRVAFTARGAAIPDVLADRDFKLLQTERYTPPDYFGRTPVREFSQVVWERRQVFSVGNMLCLSDPEWKQLSTFAARGQVVDVTADTPRRRIACSTLGGEVIVLDERLQKVWASPLDAGARVSFLADGRLAVGTLRGKALMFSADGKKQWERSLNRFVPPADVENAWLAVESTPGPAKALLEPWWARLQKQVDMGPDLARLSGQTGAGPAQDASFDGEPFATYLVEWRHGAARGTADLGLTVTENEKPTADGAQANIQRLALTARPGEAMAADYGVFKLGDRPGKVSVSVKASGDGQVSSAVSVRQLLFPSKDLIRMDALYRGVNQDALYVNPPARLQIFMNPAEEGAPHTALRVMPEALVNGRMFETEKALDKGLWWGGGAGAEHGLGHIEIPSWVEITLPQKKVLTHIAIAEDASLARAEAITVDAYVESHEVRKDVSAFEKRSVPIGFWYNVVKFRGNDSAYNVFRFPKPIFTNKIRVYVIEGHTSLTEIELYGAIPKVAVAGTAGDAPKAAKE